MAETNSGNTDNPDPFVRSSVYPNAVDVFYAGYKSPTELLRSAVVVLDTNALLVPYGTGNESLELIRKTYKQLGEADRLVVPAQVAREFADHRASKIAELSQQLSRKQSVKALENTRYPLLEGDQSYQKVLEAEKEINNHIKEYRKRIGSLIDHIGSWTWNDPVSMIYSGIFGDSVVQDVAMDRDKIMKDLKWRQANKIPPGYKDSAKADQGIGDLLIWYTILEVARVRRRNVVFVSGDVKADWYHKSEKRALIPRFELFDEFRRETQGHLFHMMQLSQFLEHFGASEQTLEEVRREEARRTSAREGIGEFLEKWQSIEQILKTVFFNLHPQAHQRQVMPLHAAKVLNREEVLSNRLTDEILRLGQVRNQVAHSLAGISENELQEHIKQLNRVAGRLIFELEKAELDDE